MSVATHRYQLRSAGIKKFKGDGDALDRLSELPDSLILQILSFLDMKDVVRTTLISKLWNYLWITIPCLMFLDSVKGCPVRTRSFINRALLLWRGAELRKFKIHLKNGFNSSSHSDMDLWVRFAMERKVEKLFISLPSAYTLPQCLYECSSIRKLVLFRCNLDIRREVQWVKLKSLKIYGGDFTKEVIEQVVSCAPLLETFLLVFLGRLGDLNIQSPTLKRLQIYSANYDPSSYTSLTILAPNLKALTISGAPFNQCLLKNISSLTKANFVLWDKWAADVEEPLSQILPTIKLVETLILTACCFKMLGVVKSKCPFSPLVNVKRLKIASRPIEPNKIVGLLENFPKLKMLVIDWKLDAKKQDVSNLLKFDDAENYIESEASILKSFLLQLRIVHIVWYSYEASILQFVEHLLTHAIMIRKIVIQKRGDMVVETEDMFQAAQKVVSLQRSFPTVELILCKK